MRIFLLACVVGCAVPDEASVQQDVLSWSTIDTYDNGRMGAGASGIGILADTVVIAAGFEWVAPAFGLTAGTIRTSTGGPFTTVTEYMFPSSTYNELQRVGVDVRNAVYVSGYALTPGWTHMITLIGDGVTFNLADDRGFSTTTPPPTGVDSIVRYRSGVAVLATFGSVNLLRYTEDGVSWFDGSLPAGVTLMGMCETGVGYLATGVTSAGDGVSMQNDDLAHRPWRLVDRFKGTGMRCAESSAGTFVAGTRGNSWFVRIGSSSLTGWVDDEVVTEGNQPPAAVLPAGGIYADSLFVTGDSNLSGSDTMLTLERANPRAWSVSDSLPAKSFGTDLAYSPTLGLWQTSTTSGSILRSVIRTYH
jgi:hypothetical protein